MQLKIIDSGPFFYLVSLQDIDLNLPFLLNAKLDLKCTTKMYLMSELCHNHDCEYGYGNSNREYDKAVLKI